MSEMINCEQNGTTGPSRAVGYPARLGQWNIGMTTFTIVHVVLSLAGIVFGFGFGVIVERTLKHEGEAVRAFYGSIPPPVVVGIEATGSMGWFLRSMQELAVECRGASRSDSKTEARRQKHFWRTVTIRTTRDPLVIARSVREQVRMVDPIQAVTQITNAEQVLAARVGPRALVAMLLLGASARHAVVCRRSQPTQSTITRVSPTALR